MDDAESIKQQIARLKPSFDINGTDVEFGADSAGEPAVWIYLHVPENESWTVAAERSRFAEAIETAVLDANEGRRWPYVSFRSP